MNEDGQGIAGMDGFQQPIPYPTPTDTVSQSESHVTFYGFHNGNIVLKTHQMSHCELLK